MYKSKREWKIDLFHWISLLKNYPDDACSNKFLFQDLSILGIKYLEKSLCFLLEKKNQQWELTKVQKWQHSAKLQESFLVISLIFVHFTLNKHVLSLFNISWKKKSVECTCSLWNHIGVF